MLIAQDTIIAPATAAGDGAVAIVRLSGPRAEELLQRFFRPSKAPARLTSQHLYHGLLLGPDGETVDEVMAVLMRAPHSYTCEDVAEVHCHGGHLLVGRILDLFVDGGARLAAPGEFTLRAFLHGRLDLTRAQAVADLIGSRSAAAGRLALRQLEGRLSRVVYGLRDQLVELLAPIEADIDFPEEDVEHAGYPGFLTAGKAVMAGIDRLLEGFDTGRVLREGLSVLILGPPNVGKSSLLNALLGEARAIVTDIPGTTRDVIEENLVIGCIPLRLVDSAGVRETDDPIESEGVRRARDKVRSADLVLLVVDGSRPLGEDDQLALELCQDSRCLVLVNKADLEPRACFDGAWTRWPHLSISARTGFGLDFLRERIVGEFHSGVKGGDIGDTVLISDRRHRQALVRCREALGRFACGVQDNVEPEFLALELREALGALGEITGETAPEQILEEIFSRFCIGK